MTAIVRNLKLNDMIIVSGNCKGELEENIIETMYNLRWFPEDCIINYEED